MKVEGCNAKNKKDIVYANLPPAMRPVSHKNDLHVPPTTLVSDNMHRGREIHDNLGEHDDEFQDSVCDGMPQLFSQPELNDSIHDLYLPKDVAKFLGSRLKTKKFLSPGITTKIFHATGSVNGILLLTFPKMDE